MLRIIRFLLTGEWKIADPCQHEWKIIRTYSVSVFGRDQADEYDLQCQKCGDIKRGKP